MKPLTFNKNSWHYWFIKHTTDYFELNDEYDICSYTRAFIGGILIAFLTLAAGAIVIGLAICGLAYLMSLVFHFHLPEIVKGLGFWTVFFAVLVFSIIGFMKLKMKLANRSKSKPGVITHMYRSWKDKTCKRIEFQ